VSEPAEAKPPHALLRPRVAMPFLVVALIWGSTWYVITGQISAVAPSWSIVYRFALATPAMFALAIAMGQSLRMSRRGHALALLIGLTQFCGNFNFVYRAEQHLTSGVVAVMFGMLIVPNALLAWWWLGQKVTPRFFLGSLIAIAGIALLLVHEAHVARLGGNVLLGVALAVGGIMSASISNVAQAGSVGRAQPMVTLLAFSMLYGTLIDITIAWALAGPPVVPSSSAFWSGTAWLALAGSVVTFPLYYGLIREIGAGRAAYHNVLVVIVAMVISTLLEGYQWTTLAIAGSALSLVGLLVALRAKSV
jgi:drug/metabolite transporter (DMT)-like permease